MNNPKVELAYGALWLYMGDDSRIHEARKMLASAMKKGEKLRGIDAAQRFFDAPVEIENEVEHER